MDMWKYLLQYKKIGTPRRPPLINFLGSFIFFIFPVPWLFFGWSIGSESIRSGSGGFGGSIKRSEIWTLETNPDFFYLASTVFFVIGVYLFLSAVKGLLKNRNDDQC